MEINRKIIKKVEQLGFKAIAITVDANVLATREINHREKLIIP